LKHITEASDEDLVAALKPGSPRLKESVAALRAAFDFTPVETFAQRLQRQSVEAHEQSFVAPQPTELEIRHIEGETHGAVRCDCCGTLFGYHRSDAPVVTTAASQPTEGVAELIERIQRDFPDSILNVQGISTRDDVVAALSAQPVPPVAEGVAELVAAIRGRLTRPEHPYGDTRVAPIPEIDFARDAYGPGLFDDIETILTAAPSAQPVPTAVPSDEELDECYDAGYEAAFVPVSLNSMIASYKEAHLAGLRAVAALSTTPAPTSDKELLNAQRQVIEFVRASDLRSTSSFMDVLDSAFTDRTHFADHELVEFLIGSNFTPQRIRTARHDLAEAGLLVVSGQSKTPSGRSCRVWTLRKDAA